MAALATHKDPDLHRRDPTDNPLANYYNTKDNRWLLLFHMQSVLYWERFYQAVEQEDLINDPRFSTFEARAENCVALIKILDEILASKTLEEWKPRLSKLDLIFSPVQRPSEAVVDPQARANGFFMTFDHHIWGPLDLLPAPQKFTKTPGTFRTPAPAWGQHTDKVLLDLGYSWDDINSFRDNKVIYNGQNKNSQIRRFMVTLEELEKKLKALDRALKEAEKRIQIMEDAEEIRELQANYIYWLSNREWEKIVDCFAENGAIQIESNKKMQGKAEITEMFKHLTTDYEYFQEGGRILAQPVISVKGNKASGYWTMAQFRFNFTTSSQTVSLFGPGLQGRYDVKYVKEGGKWKFADMKYVRPWPENPTYGELPTGKRAIGRKRRKV
jgi:hypothetical protein